jgi:DNA-binding XRE family transcriptional regulator
MTHIGMRIKLLRESLGMTQAEMAERSGIARENIANWEQGRASPDWQTIARLADFFQTSADYLVGRTEDPSPTPAAEPPGKRLGAWLNEAMRIKRVSLLDVSQATRVPLNVLTEIAEGRAAFVLIGHLQRLGEYFGSKLEELAAMLPQAGGAGTAASSLRFGATTEQELRQLTAILQKLLGDQP